MKLSDMPKLESPFVRKEINGQYVCIPEMNKEYSWILDKEVVIATEKFDGTNVSVYIEDGNIKRILNRENIIDIWKNKDWFFRGIKRAIDEGKFKPDRLTDGQYFGELLGPKLQGNPYNLEEALWLPFDYIKEHYFFKFYYNWLDEKFTEYNKDNIITDEYIYEQFSQLFKDLKSLYFRSKGVDKSPEGIVFHNKQTGQMCKLRMDMFDWYKGNRHKWYNIKDQELKTEE